MAKILTKLSPKLRGNLTTAVLALKMQMIYCNTPVAMTKDCYFQNNNEK